MKPIASFQLDHTKLTPGVYVSRVDRVGSEIITTYDIRMKRPNVDTPLTTAATHSIEHLGAAYLRNTSALPVVYFGPMGCRTGFYLILAGEADVPGVLVQIQRMLEYILQADAVPGATVKQCGNAADHDLQAAKTEAAVFLPTVKRTLQSWADDA